MYNRNHGDAVTKTDIETAIIAAQGVCVQNPVSTVNMVIAPSAKRPRVMNLIKDRVVVDVVHHSWIEVFFFFFFFFF